MMKVLLFSCSVVSDSLRSHRLQHARLPSTSPSPRACSNSCLLSRWCHPTISSSVVPFSSCLQSFPTSGSFLKSALWFRWPKYWNFSSRISPSNEYSGLISFGIDWFDLLAVQGTLKSLLQPHSSKASILQHSAFFMVQLSHLYCYYLIVKSLSCVRLFSTPWTVCSLPGPSIHRIFQARTLEWVDISRYYYCPLFTDDNIEAQSSDATCLRSHSFWGAD